MCDHSHFMLRPVWVEALAEMLLSLFGSIFPVRFEFPLKNGVLEGVEAPVE